MKTGSDRGQMRSMSPNKDKNNSGGFMSSLSKDAPSLENVSDAHRKQSKLRQQEQLMNQIITEDYKRELDAQAMGIREQNM